MPKDTDKRVFVALMNEAKQILCVRRAKDTNNGGQIGLPGGHAHLGETPQETARREGREEIGVDIDYTKVSFLKVHRGKRTVLFARMPEPGTYIFNIDPTEVQQILWMTPMDLARLDDDNLHQSAQIAIEVLMEVEINYLYRVL